MHLPLKKVNEFCSSNIYYKCDLNSPPFFQGACLSGVAGGGPIGNGVGVVLFLVKGVASKEAGVVLVFYLKI